MSVSDQDLAEAKRIRIERSPVVTVSYNRKNAYKVGSLSTELIQKLNDKFHFDDDEVVNSTGSKTSKKNVTPTKKSKIDLQPKLEVLPKREPIIGQESIRNLLEQEPIRNRFKSMTQCQLEFMSYLRPVLKDGSFDDGSGEGWEFLSTHVQKNLKMFKEILKERKR